MVTRGQRLQVNILTIDMGYFISKTVIVPAIVAVMMSSVAVAFDGGDAPFPDDSHKCPVCGMLVHRYPDFLASITYADGQTVFFDGAKDMFKYLFNMRKYAPDRRAQHVVRVRVTEYYDMQPIDAKKAFFVVGSDVLGPMGHELIPLKSQADALAFERDHQGRRVLNYSQVAPKIINRLD